MSQSHPSKYLFDETAGLKRKATRGIIAVVAIAAVVTVYFQYMGNQMAPHLEPGAIAEVAVIEAQRQLPDARITLEQELRSAIPGLVQEGMKSFVDQAIPELRGGAEEAFRTHAQDLAGLTSVVSSDVLADTIRTHRVELLRRAEAGEQPGEFTSEAFLADLDDALGERFEQSANALPVESTAHKLKRSAEAIDNIRIELERLAKSDGLGQDERMKKRLVTTWWSFLQSHELAAVNGQDGGAFIYDTEG